MKTVFTWDENKALHSVKFASLPDLVDYFLDPVKPIECHRMQVGDTVAFISENDSEWTATVSRVEVQLAVGLASGPKLEQWVYLRA